MEVRLAQEWMNFLINVAKICFESIDVYFSDNLTAIADAHYLPYKDKSFDAVIIQADEHVINPQHLRNK